MTHRIAFAPFSRVAPPWLRCGVRYDEMLAESGKLPRMQTRVGYVAKLFQCHGICHPTYMDPHPGLLHPEDMLDLEVRESSSSVVEDQLMMNSPEQSLAETTPQGSPHATATNAALRAMSCTARSF